MGALVWAAVIELAVLQPLFPALAKWLPTGAGVALTSVGPDAEALLNPAAAALVLVAWAALISLIAARVTLRRELR